MNNTFNINRFGSLLAFDGKKYIRSFGLSLAILCGLNLVLWLLTLIFNFTMPTFPRWGVIYFAVFLGIIMVPSKAFGDINLSREGVRFAMLPVSNLEKYLSYVFFCLLTPVAIILGSWAIDSLLTLLPFGGFEHYIKHFGMFSMMQDFLTEVGALNDSGVVGDADVDIQAVFDKFGSSYEWGTIIGTIFSVGIFMFGNLLFKTHKTAKTLACMIGISYIISLFMQSFFFAKGIYPWLDGDTMGISSDIDSITGFINGAMAYNIIINLILTIGLFIGIYYKLKTQKY
ncbi:MAG: hypothetical protein IKM74_09005 [Bacteroidales bacterium]|nr:hypothetical protein [Bacteroidales bacterium]